VAGNAGWLIGEQILRLGLSMVATGMMGRSLGPAGYGVLADAQNWLLILIPLVNLGFSETIVRQLVDREEHGSARLLGTAIYLRLMASVLTTLIVLVVVTATFEGEAKHVYACLLLALPCQAPLILEHYFQFKLESKRVVVYRSIAIVVVSLLRVSLAYFSASIAWFAVSLVLDYTLMVVALVAATAPGMRQELLLSFSMAEARKLLLISWPFIFSSLLVVIYFRAEQFVIVSLLGEPALGVYSSAARLAAMPGLFSAALLASLLPIMLRRAKDNDAAAQKEVVSADFRMLLEAMTLVGYCVTAGTAIFGPFAISALFGPKYSEAGQVIMILGCNSPIVLSGTVRAQFILSKQCTVVHTWSGMVGIFFNVSMALSLIPHFGILGAAVSSVISAFISAVVTSLFFRPLKEFGVAQVRAFLLPLDWRRASALWQEIKAHGLHPILR